MSCEFKETDIDLLAKKIIQIMENNELAKLSREMLVKKIVFARLNPIVEAVYKTLKLGNVIDIRYLCLAQLAHEVNKRGLEGAIAEVGVYRGSFAARMRSLFPGRKFYLFDTFEGFDQVQLDADHSNNYLADRWTISELQSMFTDTSVEIALKTIGDTSLCIVKKGFFPDSALDLDEKFVFVSLDADLYQPILDGLKFFYERLVPGGYIMVHDFGGASFKGSEAAVLKFCDEYRLGYVPLPDNTPSAVITKSRL